MGLCSGLGEAELASLVVVSGDTQKSIVVGTDACIIMNRKYGRTGPSSRCSFAKDVIGTRNS